MRQIFLRQIAVYEVYHKVYALDGRPCGKLLTLSLHKTLDTTEVVYEGSSEKPIWGMNYYGVTLDQNLSEEAMDKALRPALMKVGEDDDILPVRGPRRFINDNYEYTFNVDGDLEHFDGVEKIRKDGKLIYKLHCTGGKII